MMGFFPILVPVLFIFVFMDSFQDFCILSWNIRGAVNIAAKRVIKELIRQWRPDIFILMETHCLFARVNQFWKKQGYKAIFISEAHGHSGGIWVLAAEGSVYQFDLLDMHHQAISFSLLRGSVKWVCSAVYASPAPQLRENLWNHLVDLRDVVRDPWILIGDFNEVLFPSEVRGGNFIASRVDKMHSMMDTCGLHDLGASGGKFTWHRHENGALRISKRSEERRVGKE